MNRDFKVKIESEEEFFDDLITQAEKIDQGIIPEKTIERLSFADMETFYRYCTPKRLQLLQELHARRTFNGRRRNLGGGGFA